MGNRERHCEVREKTNKMQQLDVHYQFSLTLQFAHDARSQKPKGNVMSTATHNYVNFILLLLLSVISSAGKHALLSFAFGTYCTSIYCSCFQNHPHKDFVS